MIKIISILFPIFLGIIGYKMSSKKCQNIFENRMIPLTLNGLDEGMKLLN